MMKTIVSKNILCVEYVESHDGIIFQMQQLNLIRPYNAKESRAMNKYPMRTWDIIQYYQYYTLYFNN